MIALTNLDQASSNKQVRLNNIVNHVPAVSFLSGCLHGGWKILALRGRS